MSLLCTVDVCAFMLLMWVGIYSHTQIYVHVCVYFLILLYFSIYLCYYSSLLYVLVSPKVLMDCTSSHKSREYTTGFNYIVWNCLLTQCRKK